MSVRNNREKYASRDVDESTLKQKQQHFGRRIASIEKCNLSMESG